MKREFKKFYMILIMCFAMLINMSVVYGAGYDKSFGQQLDGKDRASGYSVLFYNAFKDAYVYSENDGTDYAGLSKVITNDQLTLRIPLQDCTYSFKATDGDFNQIAQDWVNNLSEDVTKALFASVDAFVNDYPAVYWFDTAKNDFTCEVLSQGNNITLTVNEIVITVGTSFDHLSSAPRKINANIINAVQKIVDDYGLTDNSTDVEILKAAHDYVVTELSYNHDEANAGSKTLPYAYTSYGLFSDDTNLRSVVCEGYAEGFKVIADKLAQRFGRDFQTIIVSGKALNGNGNFENHEWNQVKIDGKWYGMDVTWDDQSIGIMYIYFLSGNDSIGYKGLYKDDHLVSRTFTNHKYAKSFMIPSISDDSCELAASIRLTSENLLNQGIVHATVTLPTTQDTQSSSRQQASNDSSASNVTQTNTTTENTNTVANTVAKTNTTKTSTKNTTVKVTISKAKVSKIKAQKLKKGKACKPSFTVKYKGKKLKKGKDYTVKYSKNKKKGKGKIQIIGKGSFSGRKIVYFTIK
ncbi:MAG: hypothetical protein K6G88_09915 [Lachnospiraceae bacterium]|nr:hypothetical protein [Lachnospiraceae bacterium]